MEPEIVAPSILCFHCQQMAEKYLKAFIVRVINTFPSDQYEEASPDPYLHRDDDYC